MGSTVFLRVLKTNRYKEFSHKDKLLIVALVIKNQTGEEAVFFNAMMQFNTKTVILHASFLR